jgi:hypothetical protein
MKFALALGVLFSLSAFAANTGFDCRIGDDPHGGKFCVYRISQCVSDDCTVAAECAVKEYANQVTWSKISSIEALTVEENYVKFSVMTSKGEEYQLVSVEKDGSSCKAVALKIKQ